MKWWLVGYVYKKNIRRVNNFCLIILILFEMIIRKIYLVNIFKKNILEEYI